MFARLRHTLFGNPAAARQSQPAPLAGEQVSRWAEEHGLQFAPSGADTFGVQGRVRGRPWRMELGPSIRDYIQGEELRARAELQIEEDVAAVVISRPLKEALERRAFALITDSLQTTAEPGLPEEMRWVALYDEVGWEAQHPAFRQRFATLAQRREDAAAWVSPPLAGLLMEWPEARLAPSAPLLLVLLRGRCYFRMAFHPAEPATLQHAMEVFTLACEEALDAFRSSARP